MTSYDISKYLTFKSFGPVFGVNVKAKLFQTLPIVFKLETLVPNKNFHLKSFFYHSHCLFVFFLHLIEYMLPELASRALLSFSVVVKQLMKAEFPLRMLLYVLVQEVSASYV